MRIGSNTPHPLPTFAASECDNKATNLFVYLEGVYEMAAQVSGAGNVEYEQAQQMYWSLVGELKAASVLLGELPP